MIPYVQSIACQQVPPPYHFPGVTVNAFIWEASMTHIQAYCDEYFNLGDPIKRGFVYKAATIWPYATLLVIDYPQMIATANNVGPGWGTSYADGGYVTQKEVFVALPLLRYGTRPETALWKAAIEWALPFIIVQNPMSSVCGREMLGLEKLLAEISLGEGEYPDSFSAAVKLPGWASLRPGEMQQNLPFLDVVTGPATPTIRGSAVQDSLWTLFSSNVVGQTIGALGGVSNLIDALSAGLTPTAMQTVSLKQIRDAADPRRALHQSLISCRSKYSNMENFKFYNENDVKITIHDRGSFSEVFRVALNLPQVEDRFSTKDRPLSFTPAAAFRFNATIDFDQMRTLHTFQVDQGPGLPPAAGNDDMMSPWLRPLRGFFGRPRT